MMEGVELNIMNGALQWLTSGLNPRITGAKAISEKIKESVPKRI